MGGTCSTYCERINALQIKSHLQNAGVEDSKGTGSEDVTSIEQAQNGGEL
jgi:hypothetical protein